MTETTQPTTAGQAEPPTQTLVERLQDEADLCRNEGADDIAALLDEAWQALSYYRDSLIISRDPPPYVPAAVWLPADVRGDRPFGHHLVAPAGVHECQSNKWGAVSVLAQNGERLGVKPAEFHVVSWRPNVN